MEIIVLKRMYRVYSPPLPIKWKWSGTYVAMANDGEMVFASSPKEAVFKILRELVSPEAAKEWAEEGKIPKGWEVCDSKSKKITLSQEDLSFLVSLIDKDAKERRISSMPGRIVLAEVLLNKK